MRNKPRIDIVGSCVSRDVFNSRFTDGYKDYVEIGETVYQTALPSLIDETPAPLISETDKIKRVFIQTLNEEYSGNNLQRVIDSRPDFILFDFFADVHMGVTRKMGRYVTRNHMAFQILSNADDHFEDQDIKAPDRMRFGDNEYNQLAVKSLRTLSDRLKSDLPKTELIINSARFSTAHIDETKTVHEFANTDSLQRKNTFWDLLDVMAVDELDAQRISHGDSLFIASPNHPWGLHSVHYTQAYYDNLWKEVRRITES
ncbi:MAG: DUF6270 domain-containing protein [Candidatus Saccharimonadales bacterium]